MDHTTTPSPADGDQLSAYLAGDLDDAEVAALEARLGAEPALRDELERQRELQEAFAGLRAPAMPAGAGDRLRARLAAERTAVAEEGGSEASEEAPAPISLDAARARRRPGGIAWSAIGGVAAALVAVAVVGAGVLRTGGSDTADLASGGAADSGEARAYLDEGTADDDRLSLESAPQADTGEAAAGGADGVETLDAPAAAEASVRPILADDGVVLGDEVAVRDHLSGRQEAQGLLGLAGADAQEVAAAFAVAVRGGAPFADGTRPDACLDTVLADAPGPVVPARVEAVTYAGLPALAYVLVTAPSPDGALERVEAWVLEPTGCATRLVVSLPT
jgi:hypothetical protein